MTPNFVVCRSTSLYFNQDF